MPGASPGSPAAEAFGAAGAAPPGLFPPPAKDLRGALDFEGAAEPLRDYGGALDFDALQKPADGFGGALDFEGAPKPMSPIGSQAKGEETPIAPIGGLLGQPLEPPGMMAPGILSQGVDILGQPQLGANPLWSPLEGGAAPPGLLRGANAGDAAPPARGQGGQQGDGSSLSSLWGASWGGLLGGDIGTHHQ